MKRKILSLDHVAIAVRRIADHLPLYRKTLGLKYEGTTPFKEYGVRIASLKLPNARIELIEPLNDRSDVQKFLARRGEGLHHIALALRPELEGWISHLGKQGLRWIDPKPRRGLHGSRICFLHPQGTGHVLLEFVQHRSHRTS